jgi:glycosyltransferase involved in cell wall biosynthesis
MLGWELPPHNSGGLGVACLHLSRALAEQGVEIDFVVPYEAEHELKHMKVLHATGLDPLHRFGGGAYDTNAVSGRVLDNGRLSLRDVQHRYVEFVDEYLTSNTVDAVHAHDWLTYEAGMLAKEKYGMPLIAHVHATEFDRGGPDGGNPMIREIEYAGLLAADVILAVSEATKQLIVERYEVPAEKIQVVYNGFDPASFADDYHYDGSLCRYLESQRQEGQTIVSSVGRLTLQKGNYHLLNAAARALTKHPDLVFVVAGDGEQRDTLIEQAAELGIAHKVVFAGFIRGRELRDIYSVSDIFVMSSVSEPFGLTALEAAHHGNALILSKQSGVGEVIWSAMKYDYWDEEKLANAMVALAEWQPLADCLRRGAQREYARISWDDVAAACRDAYARVAVVREVATA